MRIVFSGASPTAIMAARQLIKQGHDIVIIELDKEKIDKLSEELDCSFLHGDAGKPAILSQVDPKNCDFLFCLTDNDQANIITSASQQYCRRSRQHRTFDIAAGKCAIFYFYRKQKGEIQN